MRERNPNLKAELHESISEVVSNVTFNDGVDAADTAPASLQETPAETLLLKDEQIADEGHAATTKPIGALANRRPNMPQGLRSLSTLNVVQKAVTAPEEYSPVVDDNTVIRELHFPTIGTAAFSNLKGAQDEASLEKICNTKRFTAELLQGHRDLK